MDLPLDKKLWKIRIGPPGLRASGPPGRWAVVGRGPVGLQAAGPLGGRGPWAAGLFLAKNMNVGLSYFTEYIA